MYNYNESLNKIVTNRKEYEVLVQEYLIAFTSEYATELSYNYTPYKNLLDKLPISDKKKVKAYMESYQWELKEVLKDGIYKRKFTTANKALSGAWYDKKESEEEGKKSEYDFYKSLKSFIAKAKKNGVSEETIATLQALQK